MSNLLRKTVLGAVAVVAMAGAAQSATLSLSGGTSGAIPNGATNEGLMPLFGVNTLSGYYGSAVNLVGNSALQFDLLGAEAGNTNTFTYVPTGQSLVDAGGGSLFNLAGLGSFSANVLEGLLGFSFTTSGAGGSVANGANPDNTIPSPSPGVNFFASFGDGVTTSGSVLYLFFDDDGANNDDNHDDLVIRVSVVPLPAGGLLLLGGLGALTLLRRRKAA